MQQSLFKRAGQASTTGKRVSSKGYCIGGVPRRCAARVTAVVSAGELAASN